MSGLIDIVWVPLEPGDQVGATPLYGRFTVEKRFSDFPRHRVAFIRWNPETGRWEKRAQPLTPLNLSLSVLMNCVSGVELIASGSQR